MALRFKHSLNIIQAVCYFNAERILKYIKELFRDDSDAKRDLVNYQEPHGGNLAIHFAVLKGNKRAIDILLECFGANPLALTANGLCVLHCAAQFERGVLSIEYFSHERFGINFNYQDRFKCTPLHFAVLNM